VKKGEFQIILKDEVSKIWGKIKGNENMNYENFSRSLRTYYTKGILMKASEDLQYKFCYENKDVRMFMEGEGYWEIIFGGDSPENDVMLRCLDSS